MRIGGFIYLATAFMQMFAPNFAVFVAGRTIQGIGVGFLSMTVPIIQTEIAAPHRRGLMVGIEYTFLIAGYMLSCWVDYGFNFVLPSNLSWQGPFIIQIALSFILCTMSFYLPETPRWLAKNGFMDECLQTVADLHSNGDVNAEHVQKTFVEIQEAVVYETNLGKAGWLVSYSIQKAYFMLLTSFSGNVHQVPQANYRRHHCPNVCSAQRYQHYFLLLAEHTSSCWIQ